MLSKCMIQIGPVCRPGGKPVAIEMKPALLAAIALLALLSLAAAVDPLKKDWSKLSEKNLEESASRARVETCYYQSQSDCARLTHQSLSLRCATLRVTEIRA